MKISTKKLAQIINEEINAVLLEQGAAPTATEWLTKYPKAVQAVYNNKDKLGFSASDDRMAIANFLAGKSGMVVSRRAKREAENFLHAYKNEPGEFLGYVKAVKAGREQADDRARKRVGDITTQADIDQAKEKAQGRIAALPKQLTTVFPRGQPDKQEALARQKAMDKLNLDREDYNNYYTDKVVVKKEQNAFLGVIDIKTLVSTRKRP